MYDDIPEGKEMQFIRGLIVAFCVFLFASGFALGALVY